MSRRGRQFERELRPWRWTRKRPALCCGAVLWRGLADSLFLAGLGAEIPSESGRSDQKAEGQEMEVSSPRGVVHRNLLRCARDATGRAWARVYACGQRLVPSELGQAGWWRHEACR